MCVAGGYIHLHLIITRFGVGAGTRDSIGVTVCHFEQTTALVAIVVAVPCVELRKTGKRLLTYSLSSAPRASWTAPRSHKGLASNFGKRADTNTRSKGDDILIGRSRLLSLELGLELLSAWAYQSREQQQKVVTRSAPPRSLRETCSPQPRNGRITAYVSDR